MNLISPNLVFLDATNMEDDRTGVNPPRMNEFFFSWRPCQCCGDTLGGNRLECNALIKHIQPDGTHELVNQDVYDCCESCVVKWQ
jgi:hypothetical protein